MLLAPQALRASQEILGQLVLPDHKELLALPEPLAPLVPLVLKVSQAMLVPQEKLVQPVL